MGVAKIGEAGYERVAGDHYQTPGWVTEYLLDHIVFDGMIWEPAAGSGNISDVLKRRRLDCVTSDLGTSFGNDYDQLDFLGYPNTIKLIDDMIKAGLRNIIMLKISFDELAQSRTRPKARSRCCWASITMRRSPDTTCSSPLISWASSICRGASPGSAWKSAQRAGRR